MAREAQLLLAGALPAHGLAVGRVVLLLGQQAGRVRARGDRAQMVRVRVFGDTVLEFHHQRAVGAHEVALAHRVARGVHLALVDQLAVREVYAVVGLAAHHGLRAAAMLFNPLASVFHPYSKTKVRLIALYKL